jgi:hypothetical protein
MMRARGGEAFESAGAPAPPFSRLDADEGRDANNQKDSFREAF